MNEQMSCSAVREGMLAADLDELRGIGESDVATHINSCDACARRAHAILHAYRQLDDGLSRISTISRDDLTAVRSRRRLTWLPLPLAAAAALALLMIPRMRSGEEPPDIEAIAQRMFRESPVVSPPPGRLAIVLEKNDMTIVWLHSQEKP